MHLCGASRAFNLFYGWFVLLLMSDYIIYGMSCWYLYYIKNESYTLHSIDIKYQLNAKLKLYTIPDRPSN